MSVRHFGEHHEEIVATFETMRSAWETAEEANPNPINFTAYHESFLDMARAVVASRYLAARPVLVVEGREKRRAIEAWREADADLQILKAGNGMCDLLLDDLAALVSREAVIREVIEAHRLLTETNQFPSHNEFVSVISEHFGVGITEGGEGK